MKKIKFIRKIITLIFLFTVSSCSNDWLEIENPNSITSGSFFSTDDDFVMAVNTLFGDTEGGFNELWYGGSEASNLRSDAIALAAVDFAQFAQYYSFNNDASNGISDDIWSDAYSTIFKANTILKQMDSYQFTDPDLAVSLNAQIHFFRGASFFRIAHAYGTGPIPLDPAETEDQFNVAAETAENLYAQAIQDLTIAKTNLPSEQEEVGRPTKGAATAFLGKLYLYRAGYLNDDSSYGLAASEFEEIITTGGYSLTENWLDNFVASTENNSESIYEAQYDVYSGSYNATQQRPGTASVPGISGEIVFKPSEWIFEEMSKELDNDSLYDVRLLRTLYFEGGLPLFGVNFADLGDGLVCASGGGGEDDSGGGLDCWEEDFTGEDSYWTSAIADLYPDARITEVMLNGCWDPVAESEYENVTVKLDRGCSVVFNHWEESIIGNGCEASNDGGSFSGWLRKYLSEDLACYPVNNVNNERIIRYADILLMYAEANFKAGGNISASIDAVNLIRERANLPASVDSNGNALDATNIMDEIEHQRVMEFVMEGTRYYDMIRWGVLKERLQAHGFPDGAATLDEEKHKYFPIPVGEVLYNELIDQNPLW